MARSKLLPYSFAVAILAAHCHCLVEHARELRAALPCPSLAAAHEFPVTPGCENESGCICKGATLVAAVDAPPMDVSYVDFHDLLAASNWDVVPSAFAKPLTDARHERAPCLSAQEVRALLQSFLI